MSDHTGGGEQYLACVNQTRSVLAELSRPISRRLPPWIIILTLTGIFQGNIQSEVIFTAHFDRSLDADYARGAREAGGANSFLTSGNAGYPFKDSAINEAADLTAREAWVSYAAAGNFCLEEGTIAFWIKLVNKPTRKGHHVYFVLGEEGTDLSESLEIINKASFRIQKVEKTTRLQVTSGQLGKSASVDISDWEKDEWHHVAATWNSREPSRLALYIDGCERAVSGYRNMLNALPQKMRLGFPWWGWGASATIDEFVIHDKAIPANAIKADYEQMIQGCHGSLTKGDNVTKSGNGTP